jgi:hypothetical protein
MAAASPTLVRRARRFAVCAASDLPARRRRPECGQLRPAALRWQQRTPVPVVGDGRERWAWLDATAPRGLLIGPPTAIDSRGGRGVCLSGMTPRDRRRGNVEGIGHARRVARAIGCCPIVPTAHRGRSSTATASTASRMPTSGYAQPPCPRSDISASRRLAETRLATNERRLGRIVPPNLD